MTADRFTRLEVPGPTETVLTAPFWRAAEEGRLILQHCDACSRMVFYPRALCPFCWSARLSWRDGSGLGRLKSYSAIHRPGHPGWVPAAPYIVGLIQLDEGPTMLSLIVESTRGSPSVGARVRFAPTRIGGRTMPCFSIEYHETLSEDAI